MAAKLVKRLPMPVNNMLAEHYLPDSFWLHRTNSVGKQKELADKYKGIEFDIIYYAEQRAFENSHDEESLEKYNLEQQLATYQKIGKERGIWFDFKNLSMDNAVLACADLDNLLHKYGVSKEKVYVESKDWQALGVFKNSGYKTSYYFPYYDMKKLSAQEREAIKVKTQGIAASGNVDAVSFYGEYYDFVSSMDLPNNIALLTWLNGYSWSEVLWREKFAEIRNDKRIKVILVTDKSKFDR